MVDLWAVTNVGELSEPHPTFMWCMWPTERREVTEFKVGLALCNVTPALSPAAAGEQSLDDKSLLRGIFVVELLEVELGAIFRSGFVAEGFDVWPPTPILFVGLSMHSI